MVLTNGLAAINFSAPDTLTEYLGCYLNVFDSALRMIAGFPYSAVGTGVTIHDAYGNQNWQSIQASFNASDASGYTYKIYTVYADDPMGMASL
jgi:hypothetical protein